VAIAAGVKVIRPLGAALLSQILCIRLQSSSGEAFQQTTTKPDR
jgi:hypothetical protein